MRKVTAMKIRIVQEKLCDKFGLTSGIVFQHWEEIARNKHIMVLNPDIERYQAIEDAGALLALFAYDGDEIIGYSVTVVSAHLHYINLGMAQNDVLYLLPRYRGASGVGIRLIRETERVARTLGADLMVWHAKDKSSLADILPRMGYQVQDILFSKELTL